LAGGVCPHRVSASLVNLWVADLRIAVTVRCSVDVDRADVDRVAGGSTWTGDGATGKRCNTRPVKGLPTWKIARYADDLLVLVNGTRQDTEPLRDQIAMVRHKRGTDKWYVYTFVGKRPVRSVKANVRALTRKTSQQDLGFVLHQLNVVLRGWAYYFRHAVAKDTVHALDNFTWWRVVHMLRTRHRWSWMELRRRHTPLRPGAGCPSHRKHRAGASQRDPGDPVSLPRQQDPTPWVTGTA
jgi:hypothetical protein